MDEHALHQILTTARVIAVVGHSDKPHRTSYQIAQYLRRAGYTVYPVNPQVSQIDGQRSYAALADVPAQVDIVNVFRRAEYLLDVVEAAVQINAGSVWAQLGVHHAQAARKAHEAGLPMVMDNCIKVTHQRLVRG